jgi:hypothetical protein
MKRSREQSPDSQDAPIAKQSKLTTFLSEKADHHTPNRHAKIAGLFKNLEEHRKQKYENSDEDYSELSFDVVIHILEFYNFTCPIELSRLFLLGPLKKPRVEHYSHVSKIYFGFKTGMPRQDIRLVFPSITICDEVCDTLYNESGEIFSRTQDVFLPYLPSGISALSEARFDSMVEIIDLTRFKRLKSYSDAETDYRIILLPDTVRYCSSGAIKVEQVAHDIEGLQVQYEEDIPFKKLTKLKKFTSTWQSLPTSAYTTLLTNDLVYVDIMTTVVEIYPTFSISPSIHYLRVNNIVVQSDYAEQEFSIPNNIRAFRCYKLIAINAWKAMFKIDQLEYVYCGY